MAKIKAGLVGISGYAGMELARLLANHPAMELTMACSRAEKGKRLGEYYPFLEDLPGSQIIIEEYTPEKAAENCELVFLAVPAGTAIKMAPELLDKGLKVVDFSADFRINDAETYTRWYKQEHSASHLLPEAVYGLPELYGDRIRGARLVANPGCYPTAAILGLNAALTNDLISTDNIIIDAKSGASGAGRKAAVPTLFCEISDNFRAYGAPTHRHTPEIEQELGKIASQPLRISFTPHIVPMKRGILATIYTTLKKSIPLKELQEIHAHAWAPHPWVRVIASFPETVNVRGSMFCDIHLVMDERTNRLIIFSVIDNLCRGASGQAIANANLMCGLEMTAGLGNLCPLV